MKQEYAKYTAEDHQVWRILYNRQIKNLPGAATQEYLEGIKRIQFTADHIPNFEQVNHILKGITGWQLYVVPGLLGNKEFFELMKNRNFCATTWLRKMSQLDYLEEPDMFHDVFGHVPLLTNPDLCRFLEALSGIALHHIDNDLAIELISRIYWFTVEFGLIKESGQLRIYGAGILSSGGETEYALRSPVPQRVPFAVKEIMLTPYIKDKFQPVYFVVDSYEQLYDSIPEIDRCIAAEVENSLRVKAH